MAAIDPSDNCALNLDHLGIVSAVSKDLGLVDKIDQRLPRFDVRRIVSNGNAVLAMILNGLGFSNRRLYLVAQFLQNKPVDRLISPSLKAEHFDDHVLGRALDEIAEYGASKLFTEVAFEIALEQNLLGKEAHIDTTSFSFEGSYLNQVEEPVAINVCHGFSKDDRPGLKQVVLNMAVSGPANLPIFMQPLSGNKSDKDSLYNGIDLVRNFRGQLRDGFEDFVWIADSALYSKEKLLATNDFYWISRVPVTIKEAKLLVSERDDNLHWIEFENGYRYSLHQSSYGGTSQQWLLVFSQQAYEREKSSFENLLIKQDEKVSKEVWHLCNQIYGCEYDAREALQKVMKKYRNHTIEHFEMSPIEKYQNKGRPKTGTTKQLVGYQIKATVVRSHREVEATLATKGRFILATNKTDNINCDEILRSYKNQINVEQGFRFLKDPWFMADTFFLKSQQRIEALMVIMTLCLMIYNVAQYRMRKALAENNETLPNQLGKATPSPTLRWIFQMMEGVIIVIENGLNDVEKARIFNLNDLRLKIIKLFGPNACEIYGTS